MKYAFVKAQLRDYPLSMSCAALALRIGGRCVAGTPPGSADAGSAAVVVSDQDHPSSER